MAITEMFEDIEKCEVIVDDLIVGGKNTENNDRTLKQVLKRTTENDSDLMGKYKSASLINLTSFKSALKRFLISISWSSIVLLIISNQIYILLIVF